jgi:NAD(P)-dependent dehydrogenase (short-subunit alcohol dehydrogenase family)
MSARRGSSNGGSSSSESPNHRIAGRPVMITGAGSGIGRALAQRLSRLGSPVAIADIDEAGLEKTAASLSGSTVGL